MGDGGDEGIRTYVDLFDLFLDLQILPHKTPHIKRSSKNKYHEILTALKSHEILFSRPDGPRHGETGNFQMTMSPKEFVSQMTTGDVVVTETKDGYLLDIPDAINTYTMDGITSYIYPQWRLAKGETGILVGNAEWNQPECRWEVRASNKKSSQIVWGRTLASLAKALPEMSYQSLAQAKKAYIAHLKKADKAFDDSVPSYSNRK